MARRQFLSRLAQLAALPFVMASGSLQGQAPHKSLKILMKSAWVPTINQGCVSLLAWARTRGSRTRSTDLPAWEAVVLMRKTLANSVTPVGWPPVGETLEKLASRHIHIYACGACSRASSPWQNYEKRTSGDEVCGTRKEGAVRRQVRGVRRPIKEAAVVRHRKPKSRENICPARFSTRAAFPLQQLAQN